MRLLITIFLLLSFFSPLRAEETRLQEAHQLFHSGMDHYQRFQYSEAIADWEEAAGIYETLGRAYHLRGTWINLAAVYQELGEMNKSLIYLERVLVQAKAAQNKPAIGEALGRIGYAYYLAGDLDRAATYQWEAADVFSEMGDKRQVVDCLDTLLYIYKARGELTEALKCGERSLKIKQRSGAAAKAIQTLEDLRDLCFSFRQLEKATEYSLAALRLKEKTGDEAAVSAELSSLGMISALAGHLKEAVAYHEQALEIDHRLGKPAQEAATLSNLGTVYTFLNDYQNAFKCQDRSLELDQEAGNESGQASTLSNRALIYQTLEMYPEALSCLEKTLRLASSLFAPGIIKTAHYQKGEIYWREGEYDQAYSSFKLSIEAAESMLKEEDQEAEGSIIGGRTDPYGEMILLLLEMGRPAEAFDFLERAKARKWLEVFNQAQCNSDNELIRKEKALVARIGYLVKQLSAQKAKPKAQHNKDLINTLSEELALAWNDRAEVITRIQMESPELLPLVSIKPTTIKDIQQALDKHTALIEYFVAKEAILVWLIRPDRLVAVSLPVSGQTLAARINRLRTTVIDEYQTEEIGQQLYCDLIDPLKPNLEGIKHLCFIPDGPLDYLPFALLNQEGRYLIEDYQVSYAPSSSLFKRSFDKKQKGGIMAFLNRLFKRDIGQITALSGPDSKSTDREVETVSSIEGRNSTALHQAGREMLEPSLANTSFLHLAVPVRFNLQNRLYTGLVLNQKEEPLRLSEFFGFDLDNLKLLTLTRGNPGASGLVTGQIPALTNSLLYAGAPSVMITLWDSEAGTTLLMMKFYRHLKDMSKAEALRQAQLSTLREYPHPKDWARFVLFGDYR
ncbi:MAG: CHAT domain-containing protein [bacterium]